MRCSSLFILLFLACFSLPFSSVAQPYFLRDSSVLVIQNGDTLKNAWAGGLNSCQVSTIDLNLDGLKDLFIYDRSTRRISTYINDGSHTESDPYKFTTAYNHAFPNALEWVLLRDYNCDGYKDWFGYSPLQGGIQVYRNTAPQTGHVGFTMAYPLIQSYYDFGSNPYYSNLYVSSQDIPAIFDYDGDGDLDVMTFQVGGGSMELHVNQSEELYGNCDSMKMVLGTRCYGSFAEGINDNSIQMGAPCDFDVPNPRDYRHVGSTILTLDADNNGKQDIVLGDVSYNTLVLLYVTTAQSGRDTVASYDTNFPADLGGSTPAGLRVFPASFYEDVNNDGVKDLLVSPNVGAGGRNARSLWMYKNTGTNTQPNFQLQSQEFLQGDMIDVGEGSQPVFLDVNADGLMDLLVANNNYRTDDGSQQSQIAYYKNTGTATNPKFTLQTLDWLNLSSQMPGVQNLRPAFVDLDGDGDLDMVLGLSTGALYAVTNTAVAGNPPVFDIAGRSLLTDYTGSPISTGQVNNTNIGQFLVPQFVDLDRDGDLDMVLGERNGNLDYFRNDGGAGNPISLHFVTDSLGRINLYYEFQGVGYTSPAFFDFQGQYYLLCGSQDGHIRLYNHIDNNLNGNFMEISNNAYDAFYGIGSTVAVANLDGDNYPDMVLGNSGGGVVYYKGADPILAVHQPNAPKPLNLYPNPFHNSFTISTDKIGKQAQINVYNNLGQSIPFEIQNLHNELRITLRHPQEGLVLVVIEDGNQIYSGRAVCLGR